MRNESLMFKRQEEQMVFLFFFQMHKGGKV